MDVLKVGTVAIPTWVQINSEPSAVMMESGTQMFELWSKFTTVRRSDELWEGLVLHTSLSFFSCLL